MVKSTADTQKQVNLVKLHEQTRINLLQEIKNYQIEANKQRQLIHKLEIERDRYITEASDLTQKVSLILILLCPSLHSCNES